MLAKSKLNSIETLTSQALIDLEISHEEFKIIANEKEKSEKMKESIRMMKSSDSMQKKNLKIYQPSQANMTQFTKSIDMNQQSDQINNQTEDFY